jgi:hypothetical protein
MKLTLIIKRALVETVTDIGQLSKEELRDLNNAVKRGWLSKGKAGPFPMLKTVYAVPGFDFAQSRKDAVDYMMKVAEFDQMMREARKAVGCDSY